MEDVRAQPDWVSRTVPLIIHGDSAVFTMKHEQTLRGVSTRSLVAATEVRPRVVPIFAVAESARRKGIANSLYKYFAESQAGAPVMTCEINIRPPNPGSMLFHKRMGFRQIGSQETEQGKKEVALMEKTL